MIDSIIFDLDGTLWDTICTSVKTLESIRNKYKEITKVISEDEVKASMGKPFDEIVDMYYGYLPKYKAVLYAKEAFEKNIENLMINGGDLYANTKETIIKLSKKYKLFIVSNCIEGYIESFLKTSELGEYFVDYESNGKTGLSKGENIKLIMKRNNLKNAVYVGDTMGDKEATDVANIPFVYANYGFGNVDKYAYKLDDIGDLMSIDFNI